MTAATAGFPASTKEHEKVHHFDCGYEGIELLVWHDAEDNSFLFGVKLDGIIYIKSNQWGATSAKTAGALLQLLQHPGKESPVDLNDAKTISCSYRVQDDLLVFRFIFKSKGAGLNEAKVCPTDVPGLIKYLSQRLQPHGVQETGLEKPQFGLGA